MRRLDQIGGLKRPAQVNKKAISGKQGNYQEVSVVRSLDSEKADAQPGEWYGTASQGSVCGAMKMTSRTVWVAGRESSDIGY